MKGAFSALVGLVLMSMSGCRWFRRKSSLSDGVQVTSAKLGIEIKQSGDDFLVIDFRSPVNRVSSNRKLPGL